MRKLRAVAVALGIALGLMTQSAHAAETTPHVGIYLGSTFRTTVTVNCVDGLKQVHTALYDDHFVPSTLNTPERVKIYRVTGLPGIDFANWQQVWGDVNGTVIQPNTPVPVTIPYGPTYMAVAVAEGDNFSDFWTKLSAKPPTADNSMLFPPGTVGKEKYQYPDSPGDCQVPPPPNPCDVKPPVKSITAPVNLPCPPCPTKTTTPPLTIKAPPAPNGTATSKNDEPDCDKDDPCTPCPTPTTTPPTSTSSSPSSTPTTVPTTQPTDPTGTTTMPTTLRPSASSTPSGPTLAHTGASVAVPATGALLLLAVGAGLFFYARTARRH